MDGQAKKTCSFPLHRPQRLCSYPGVLPSLNVASVLLLDTSLVYLDNCPKAVYLSSRDFLFHLACVKGECTLSVFTSKALSFYNYLDVIFCLMWLQ